MPSYISQIVTGYDIIPVTPSDNLLDLGPCRALWIGGEGKVTVTTSTGESRVSIPVPVGLFPVQCQKVHVDTSGDSATDIWAIY